MRGKIDITKVSTNFNRRLLKNIFSAKENYLSPLKYLPVYIINDIVLNKNFGLRSLSTQSVQ